VIPGTAAGYGLAPWPPLALRIGIRQQFIVKPALRPGAIFQFATRQAETLRTSFQYPAKWWIVVLAPSGRGSMGAIQSDVSTSSFPRKRESRRRIHLPAITTAHWIPACAGMTKERPWLTHHFESHPGSIDHEQVLSISGQRGQFLAERRVVV